MITFRPLTDADLAAFAPSFLKTKIEGLSRAYGACPGILETWAQEREGAITALICRFGGKVSLTAKTGDTAELAEFLRFLGAPAECEEALAKRLGFPITDRASLYQKEIVRGEEAPLFLRTEHFEVTAKRLMLADSPDIEIADEAGFVADLSHRVRHGAAMAAETEHGTAVIGFLAEEAAILSGVTTEKAYRGRGEAKRLLAALESHLNRKTLFAATRAADGFYAACGYRKTGALCRLTPIGKE